MCWEVTMHMCLWICLLDQKVVMQSVFATKQGNFPVKKRLTHDHGGWIIMIHYNKIRNNSNNGAGRTFSLCLELSHGDILVCFLPPGSCHFTENIISFFVMQVGLQNVTSCLDHSISVALLWHSGDVVLTVKISSVLPKHQAAKGQASFLCSLNLIHVWIFPINFPSTFKHMLEI